jgi:hypothetical protein
MSLSAHEKIEFERLTADLQFDDSDLNKMVKRERATAMSYAALPRISARSSEIVTLIMLVLGLAAMPFAVVCFAMTHNLMAAAIALPLGAFLCWRADVRREKAWRKANQEK